MSYFGVWLREQAGGVGVVVGGKEKKIYTGGGSSIYMGRRAGFQRWPQLSFAVLPYLERAGRFAVRVAGGGQTKMRLALIMRTLGERG
jgi:hypothetical protein